MAKEAAAAGGRTEKITARAIKTAPLSVGKTSAQPWQRGRKKILEVNEEEVKKTLDRACRSGRRSAGAAAATTAAAYSVGWRGAGRRSAGRFSGRWW